MRHDHEKLARFLMGTWNETRQGGEEIPIPSKALEKQVFLQHYLARSLEMVLYPYNSDVALVQGPERRNVRFSLLCAEQRSRNLVERPTLQMNELHTTEPIRP